MSRFPSGGRSLSIVRRWSLAAILAATTPALLACGGERTGPEAVQLRFDYREGDTLTYAYRATGTATFPDTTGTGEPTERAFERTMRVEGVATDVTPAGNYELALTYHLEHDSLHRSKGLPDQIRLQVEMTPQGRILDVTGVEAARPLYGDIDFQSYFEQSQPVFPERALKIGDSWTQEVKVVSPASEPVVTSSTYVLESLVEEGGTELAVIRYEGDIYLPVRFPAPADSVAGEGNRTTSVEERIEVRGRIYFDHAAGVMRRVETTAEATFTRMGFREGEPVRREMKLREESEMRLMAPGG